MVQSDKAGNEIEQVWPDAENKDTDGGQQPDDSIVLFQSILSDEFDDDSNQGKT